MTQHRNFGGQRINGSGAIDLSRLQNQQAQAVAEINQLIHTTARDLFVGLVSQHVPLGGGLDRDKLRACAKLAVESAPFFAEAVGLVTINTPAPPAAETPIIGGETDAK